MKKKEKKEKWVDDGRVIANMDIDGMPGNFYRPKRRRQSDEFGKVAHKPEPVELTRTERRAITRGVILAFLAVLFVFSGLITLVALFCSKVWLS